MKTRTPKRQPKRQPKYRKPKRQPKSRKPKRQPKRQPAAADVFRDPSADPRNEFLTRDDFAAGPPAPGGPSRRMPELLADQRRFTVSRLWTDIPEAD